MADRHNGALPTLPEGLRRLTLALAVGGVVIGLLWLFGAFTSSYDSLPSEVADDIFDSVPEPDSLIGKISGLALFFGAYCGLFFFGTLYALRLLLRVYLWVQEGFADRE